MTVPFNQGRFPPSADLFFTKKAAVGHDLRGPPSGAIAEKVAVPIHWALVSVLATMRGYSWQPARCKCSNPVLVSFMILLSGGSSLFSACRGIDVVAAEAEGRKAANPDFSS